MTDSQTVPLTTRWATMNDLPALRAVMQRAIDSLQSDVLTPEQVIASHAVMGLDTQLIRDGTYLIAERNGEIAGCGGWSNRATLFGGDHSTDLRNPELLDPACDAAKIRAMYTDPAHARQGVGRLILRTCEDAAAAAGFTSAEMMATLAGERLYAVAGYHAVERVEVMAGNVALPLVRMRKAF